MAFVTCEKDCAYCDNLLAYTRRKVWHLPNTMSEHKFQGKYRIESARLAGYDYGSNGLYFVTICTQDRACTLGEIITDATGVVISHPTSIGQRAIDGWFSIPTFSPFVQLDAFQLTPDHVHGIVQISKTEYTDWQSNRFRPQRENLASIIRDFKAGVKTHATMNQIAFGWQPRYYDRIIRNEDELNRIRQYIDNNPAKWHQDRDNVEGIFM